MAEIVDWDLKPDALRSALLQLTTSKLVQACKYKNVPYSSNKLDTIDSLIKVVHPSIPKKTNVHASVAMFEEKMKQGLQLQHMSHLHGKHQTRFDDHELEAVGLGWLMPPKLQSFESAASEMIDEEAEDENHEIRPQTTQAIAYGSPYDYYQETNEIALKEELNKKIESYGTFEVMSSLLFGFAVSVAFENVNSTTFEEEDIWTDMAEILFSLFITVVLICNAYTMIVVSLTYFHVHRYMADKEYIMAMIYLKMYANYRKYARRSFYIGLVCFILAILIYLLPLLSIISKGMVSGVLLIGLFIIIYTLVTMTNPAYIADRNNAGHKKFLSAFIEKGGMHEKTIDRQKSVNKIELNTAIKYDN